MNFFCSSARFTNLSICDPIDGIQTSRKSHVIVVHIADSIAVAMIVVRRDCLVASSCFEVEGMCSWVVQL